MEGSPAAMAPLILRNLLVSLFLHADKSLIHLIQKFRLLQIVRRFLLSAFLFFLGLLPSLFPSLRPGHHHSTGDNTSPGATATAPARCAGESGVQRALTQLLLLMNDIPVSSRKYEVVRSLVEKLIENDHEALREVNSAVLTAAFGRTLSQLEAAVSEQGRWTGVADVAPEARESSDYDKGSVLLRGVKYCGEVMWRYAMGLDEPSRSRRGSDEKLAAEILWLAQKMAASGCVCEAVCKWAAASNLGWLALTAEPRLQGSLVKVSVFLIKQAKEMGNGEEDRQPQQRQQEPQSNTRSEQIMKTRQTKMKMLISWIPLLCSANNGTDAPVVSTSERAELEKILEDIIWTLDEEEQERVLSVWLHHFTYCSASDWPNLRSCYQQWFDASRTKLLHARTAVNT